MAAAKTPSKRPTRPGKHGGTLRTGNPGNKGGTGRPPDEFKALCQAIASRDITVEAVKGILEDPSHPQFMPALKWATEHGYGKPMQAMELTGKDGGAVKTERVLRWGGVEIPL